VGGNHFLIVNTNDQPNAQTLEDPFRVNLIFLERVYFIAVFGNGAESMPVP
jgi:hypothetical protein